MSKLTYSSSHLRAVHSALLGAALLTAFAAQAQKPVDKGEPPAGKPPSAADSKLAPHAPKMTVTAPSEIPLDRIKLPKGFKVELWAHGMPGVRMMARGSKGTIWAGTRFIGRVYEIKDKGGQREHRVLAEKLV